MPLTGDREKHPPASIVLDQRRVYRGDVIHQNALRLPRIRKILCAVESKLAGTALFGQHEKLTVKLEYEWVGKMSALLEAGGDI